MIKRHSFLFVVTIPYINNTLSSCQIIIEPDAGLAFISWLSTESEKPSHDLC